MNLKQFRAIGPAIDKEVADVFAKYGLKVGKRRATIDERDGTVSFRLTLADTSLKDADGNATTPEAQRYKNDARYLGLSPEWLNRPFKRGNKTAKVVGLRSGRTAKPVLVEIDGKQYIFDCETIRQCFGLQREMTTPELQSIAAGQ